MKVEHKMGGKKTNSEKSEIGKIRKKQLLEANKEEDRTIKRLEKLLRINKKKSKKKVPSSFIDDGLDYLLGGLDNKDGALILSDDSMDLESDVASVEKFHSSSKTKRKLQEEDRAPQPNKKRTLTDLLKEKEGYGCESECGKLSDDDHSLEYENDLVDSENNTDFPCSDEIKLEKNKIIDDNDKEKQKPKIWEDIYGRFRDEEGNVIKNPKIEKYIPPSLRKEVPNNQKQEELLKIKRNLKGLLNRLSESNLQPISYQVEEMYMKHGRNDINQTLFSLISDLVLTSVQTAPRLIMEQAMLIALLHANIGSEIGAYFLQHLVGMLDSLFKVDNYGEGKMCNNVLTFLSHLYNFKAMKVEHKMGGKKTNSEKSEIGKIRKKQLLEANKEEDRTIKRLEKLLRINKKKSKKKVPSSFIDDGLDYLLGGLDNKDGALILSDDSMDLESDVASVEKFHSSSKTKRKLQEEDRAPQPNKKRTLTDLLKEKEGYGCESECGKLSDDDHSLEYENDLVDSENNTDFPCSDEIKLEKNKIIDDNDKEKQKPKIWEDIYGRFRDEEGNVIKNPKIEKYIPPSLRKEVPNNQKQEELLKIKRNLKGLLNRLSESNLQPISYQVEEMYMKHGRNDINQTLFSLISDLVLTSVQTAPRLIMEQAMLIALLHANIGSEIGAYFLQHLVGMLDSLFKVDNYGEGKMCNNVLTFLSHLYNFKAMKVEHKMGGKKTNSEKSEIGKIRKKQLLEANKEEDRTIKRLEKLLRINKKKSKKKVPSSFIDDGLDYLLGGLDNKDGALILSDDSMDLESDVASVEKFHSSSKTKRKLQEEDRAPQPNKKRTLTDLLKEKEGYGCESECGKLSDDDHSLEYENDLVDSENNTDFPCSDEIKLEKNKIIDDNDKEKQKPKIWEDIYGRFRDEEGNVIKNPKIEKYIPPSLRKEVPNNQKQEELLKIKRNLKGLLNRLSESNLQPISYQVEEMYMKHGRNDINQTLFSLISDLVLTSVQTAPRLIMEQAMLIALLHANIGSEIGAYFLQHLVGMLDSLFKVDNYGEGKMCNNVLTFLSHLYNFKVTHCTLIFDIFRKLIDSFQSKDIELIQLFLKNIGFVLRKDDPLSLKEIILSIQAKASAVKKEDNDSRVTFMVDTLTAIRNNNIYKIPDYDPSIIEHSKKVLRGMVRKGCYMQELAVSYEDLIKADERGRWWIVGSAWSERENSAVSNVNQKDFIPHKTEYSEKILQLAQKQHMNTDVRKSVFCIIMTAEDYMDAFQKLLKLNLKNQQEREIINVILHCALQEKNFNPYYAFLAGKFCSFARKFQMTLQFSLWDKFKELNNMKPHQIRNLATFLSHCFISGALPLSVLKVIHFSEMDKTMLKFFRQILLSVLLHESEETCIQVFKRISNGKNLNLLRESLRLFMHHFLLKNLEKYSPEDAERLTERVKVAENALSSTKSTIHL